MNADPNCSRQAILPTFYTQVSDFVASMEMGTYHDSNVGHRTEKDAKRSPNLPRHDEATTDVSGYNFGREDRDSPIKILET